MASKATQVSARISGELPGDESGATAAPRTARQRPPPALPRLPVGPLGWSVGQRLTCALAACLALWLAVYWALS
jgi:hypothetical protein